MSCGNNFGFFCVNLDVIEVNLAFYITCPQPLPAGSLACIRGAMTLYKLTTYLVVTSAISMILIRRSGSQLMVGLYLVVAVGFTAVHD